MVENDFGLWMLRQRYAVRTVRAYGRTIERAETWMRATKRRPLRRASWKDLREYGETFPRSYSSRQQLVSSLKAYWQFLGRRDCPAWGVVCPRKPRMQPKPIDRDELDRAFGAARQLGSMQYAMVCCLYYLGLRREEAATLTWEQLGEDRVRIVGKGGIQAYVPLREEVVEALGALERGGSYVFPGRWGGHIALGTVSHWITTVAEISEVDIHPHRFRHTAITNAYDGTNDVFAVQEFARHADPRTTRGYTRVRWDRVVAATAAL